MRVDGSGSFVLGYDLDFSHGGLIREWNRLCASLSLDSLIDQIRDIHTRRDVHTTLARPTR